MAATARPTAVGKAHATACGYALIALLIVVTAMGAALAATGTLWHEVRQRDKERELLFVGLQYRRAIRLYYYNSPGAQTFPPTLAALLRDDRVPGTKRYLRRPYRDPLNDSDEWGLVRAPGGGIMGVYSLAEGIAIKQGNFPTELGWRGGRASYSEWQFVFVPPAG